MLRTGDGEEGQVCRVQKMVNILSISASCSLADFGTVGAFVNCACVRNAGLGEI